MTGSIIARKESLSGTYLAHRLLTIIHSLFGHLDFWIWMRSLSAPGHFLISSAEQNLSLSFVQFVSQGLQFPQLLQPCFLAGREKNINGLPKGTIREEAVIRCYLQGIGTTASPGGFSREFLVGVCRPVLQKLTLFQTKKWYFPHPFSDLAFKIHTYFQTWSPRNFVVIT